ncbi:hypothetical protein ACVMIH_000183 [Bradyrhizobium sp. USDA 4503]
MPGARCTARRVEWVTHAAISTRNVGWVERSETHHLGVRMQSMGFAALYPSYELMIQSGPCHLRTDWSIYRQ